MRLQAVASVSFALSQIGVLVSEGFFSAPTCTTGAKWHDLARPSCQGRFWWCGEGCLVIRSQAVASVSFRLGQGVGRFFFSTNMDQWGQMT